MFSSHQAIIVIINKFNTKHELQKIDNDILYIPFTSFFESIKIR